MLQILLKYSNSRQASKIKVHFTYTPTKKYPGSKQKFDGFCSITQEPVVVQKRYIPHLKALILSFYEPEGQALWFPNKASTFT